MSQNINLPPHLQPHGNYAHPKKKKKSFVPIVIFSLAGILGVGGFVYYQGVKKEEARQREELALAAQIKAEQDAKRQAELKAKKEALLAEQKAKEAEAKRLEAARLKAEKEEADRLAREKANVKEDVVVKKDEKTPDVEPTPVAKEIPESLKKPIPLVGISSRTNQNKKHWADAMRDVIATNSWDAFKSWITESVKTDLTKLSKFGTFDPKTLDDSVMMLNALYITDIIDPLSSEQLEQLNKGVSGGDSETFLTYLLNDKEGSLSLLAHSLDGRQEAKDLMHILTVWQKLWSESSPEFQTKYQNLALSIALVRPGKQESCRVKDGQRMTSEQIYKKFIDSAENKKLKTDITKLSPRDLVYVVNLGIPESEMDWAQKNVKFKQKNWAQAYPMIRYRMDRAAHGLNLHPYYTFKEILKEGGICMDQAYFAVNTARANGIPAAYVTGSGNRGPHAWFVYLSDDIEWVSSGGYGYTSGTTTNPLTGKGTHESLFLMSSDRKAGGHKLDKMLDCLLLYRVFMDNGLSAKAKPLLEMAQKMAPSYPQPWMATIDWMQHKDNNATLEDWEALVKEMRKRFVRYPDFLEIAQNIEKEYIFPHKDASDVAKQLGKDRRTLDKKTDGTRTDLSANALQREINQLVELGNLDQANKVFKKAIDDSADKADGFIRVMSQYSTFIRENPSYANDASSYVLRIYRRKIESKTDDLFRLKQEVSVSNGVVAMLRIADNEKQADRLEQESKKRLAKATDKVKTEKRR